MLRRLTYSVVVTPFPTVVVPPIVPVTVFVFTTLLIDVVAGNVRNAVQ